MLTPLTADVFNVFVYVCISTCIVWDSPGVQVRCGALKVFLPHRGFQRIAGRALGDPGGRLMGHEQIRNVGLFFHSSRQMAPVFTNFCFDIRLRLTYY